MHDGINQAGAVAEKVSAIAGEALHAGIYAASETSSAVVRMPATYTDRVEIAEAQMRRKGRDTHEGCGEARWF